MKRVMREKIERDFSWNIKKVLCKIFDVEVFLQSTTKVCHETSATDLFGVVLKKKLLQNLFFYETLLLVVNKVHHDTFNTKPFWQFSWIGSRRNHSCGIFILCIWYWFGRTPLFPRNQKRLRFCIQGRNLFKFARNSFFECNRAYRIENWGWQIDSCIQPYLLAWNLFLSSF